MVERARWHGPARDPYPRRNPRQPAHIELSRDASGVGSDWGQVVTSSAIGCGEQRRDVITVAVAMALALDPQEVHGEGR